jgi:hypothetical protein
LDWNLVGSNDVTTTRTRGGGKRKQPVVESSSSSSDGEWSEEEEEDDEEDDEAILLKEKPLHERVILEVKHVEQAFEKFSKCPECGQSLLLQLNTVCISTGITVHLPQSGL